MHREALEARQAVDDRGLERARRRVVARVAVRRCRRCGQGECGNYRYVETSALRHTVVLSGASACATGL